MVFSILCFCFCFRCSETGSYTAACASLNSVALFIASLKLMTILLPRLPKYTLGFWS